MSWACHGLHLRHAVQSFGCLGGSKEDLGLKAGALGRRKEGQKGDGLGSCRDRRGSKPGAQSGEELTNSHDSAKVPALAFTHEGARHKQGSRTRNRVPARIT
jgi:hypothetical protein